MSVGIVGHLTEQKGDFCIPLDHCMCFFKRDIGLVQRSDDKRILCITKILVELSLLPNIRRNITKELKQFRHSQPLQRPQHCFCPLCYIIKKMLVIYNNYRLSCFSCVVVLEFNVALTSTQHWINSFSISNPLFPFVCCSDFYGYPFQKRSVHIP